MNTRIVILTDRNAIRNASDPKDMNDSAKEISSNNNFLLHVLQMQGPCHGPSSKSVVSKVYYFNLSFDMIELQLHLESILCVRIDQRTDLSLFLCDRLA